MLADSVCLQTGLLLAVCVEWGCGGWKLCAFSPLRISPPPILLLGHLHLAICGDHSTHTTVAPPPPSHSQKQCLWFIHTLTTTHMSLCVLLGSFFFFLHLFHTFFPLRLWTNTFIASLAEGESSNNVNFKEWCKKGALLPWKPLPLHPSLLPPSFSSHPPLCWWCSRLFSLHPVCPHLSWTCSSHTASGGYTRRRRRRKRRRGETAASSLPSLHHFEKSRATTKKKRGHTGFTFILAKKKIIIITPTLPHSPFQGGHFSSLSPPFLFYPDFFLWDPGFVFATSKPLNFSGISGEVRVCSVWCFSRLFSLPIMAHAASQLKKNRGEVDVNAIEDEKEKRRKSRRASSREQKRKVTGEGWPPGRAGWLPVASSVLLSLCRWSVAACTYVCVRGVCAH